MSSSEGVDSAGAQPENVTPRAFTQKEVHDIDDLRKSLVSVLGNFAGKWNVDVPKDLEINRVLAHCWKPGEIPTNFETTAAYADLAHIPEGTSGKSLKRAFQIWLKKWMYGYTNMDILTELQEQESRLLWLLSRHTQE